MVQKYVLTKNELENVIGGKVHWGVVAGYCVAGAIVGAAGGPASAAFGCLIAGAQEISDGYFR
ncbi:class IIb bacteriocin, lactobin A/cerein 7B family [Streptococcus sp. P25B114]|nr:class IIb bacteriocin, lactobin A/cerein 7B family [Streptococcus suis]NQM28719.1 class IIb bacteriocin, lactobin A/cerein 7B family [Streptococcus suis]NRG98805.1 class IIb bacteriocin, lactobin A/cerein 7B family [Streptococcus suis]HEM2752777.1 class IIb bacteriocin, lactobin A/cerein 7B family [Streptococcus suis]HEM4252309.1 class IIb bacteriocin, lactobin A/cerein 7B family [Streptococcus suis]